MPDEGEGDYKCKNPFRNPSREVKLIEDQTYTMSGRPYPATGAYYRFVIVRALRNHGYNTLPRWPGLELGMHTNEAEAILGQCRRTRTLLEHFLTYLGSPMGATSPTFSSSIRAPWV